MYLSDCVFEQFILHQVLIECIFVRYFTPKPFFHFTYLEGMYECKLTLPPNAAFQTIIGPGNKNSHLSKQLVCLEACKKLHQMGALDDHLLPYVEEPSENDIIVKSKGSAAGAGMRRSMYE